MSCQENTIPTHPRLLLRRAIAAGPARDELVRLQKEWVDSIAICFRSGISEGHFRVDADPEQFAHDLYSVMLGYHHAQRLLRDPAADSRARASVGGPARGRAPAGPADAG